MKILITPTSNEYIINMHQALFKLGHICIIWNPKIQSIYAILDNEKPDLILCNNTDISDITIEAIESYKIPTCTFGVTKPFKYHACVLAFENLSSDLPVPLLYLKNAATIEKPYDLEQSNIVYVQKILNQSQYIECLHDKDISFKIVGDNTQLSIPEYVGHVNTLDRISLYKSAKLVILDSIDDIYNVALHGSFAILSVQNDIYPYFTAENELIDLINKYVDNTSKFKINIQKEAKKIAINNTYYHRVYEIFTKLNYTTEANECLSKISELLSHI